MHNQIIFSIFLIFLGAALLATLALYTRQSMLVAYILLGILLGPSGVELINDPKLIEQIGHIGIIFLLFLLGLHLEPRSLIKLLRETTFVTIITSLIFGITGFMVGYVSHFSTFECLVIGASMMYSSTIIGLKLLPTTILHHQRTGELVISILLLQDIIAIFTLLWLHAASKQNGLQILEIVKVFVSLPALILFAFLFEKLVLNRLIRKFDRIHEYIFLMAIGWCLALGQLAEYISLSFEVGAFIAGISLATNPIARFIAENLRPLRDFFLILFFFSLGASMNLRMLEGVLIPATLLASFMLIMKPFFFQFFLRKIATSKAMSWEIGVRMGQVSEFSLLITYFALENALIGEYAAYLVQLATIITFIVSSYWIVNRYPTPIAVRERLRRD
ncbi:MAG: cation:proton antiporter [Gammaproteobacteria bacterium]